MNKLPRTRLCRADAIFTKCDTVEPADITEIKQDIEDLKEKIDNIPSIEPTSSDFVHAHLYIINGYFPNETSKELDN